jgi:glycosyltransferase involved in cell wall biosynthesis
MVTPSFLPSTGGVETHVAEVSRRLASGGHEVTVLTTDRLRTLPARELWEGVEVERVAAWPRRRDYFFAPGIVPVARRRDWSVVHVQSYHTFVAPLAMGAALSASTPYVVTFHGGGHSSRVRHSLRGTQLTLLRPLLARAAALVAVASFEVELYGRKLGVPRDRFRLIPNGADLPAPAAPRSRRPEAVRLIASVGRLERYKGHQHVIAALPHVVSQYPDARLWIAGTGPYRAELLAFADRVGVADRVEIRAVEAEDRATMAAELSRASVVVLASQFETNPVSALEAAALGCPLVVADNSGLHELAERGLARAVSDPRDAAALAAAILDELDNPRDRPELQLPTWDDCADGLARLYESVSRGRG